MAQKLPKGVYIQALPRASGIAPFRACALPGRSANSKGAVSAKPGRTRNQHALVADGAMAKRPQSATGTSLRRRCADSGSDSEEDCLRERFSPKTVCTEGNNGGRASPSSPAAAASRKAAQQQEMGRLLQRSSQSNPLTGVATVEEADAALAQHPTIGPVLLENYKFLVQAVGTLTEQVSTLQKTVEFLSRELGARLKHPPLASVQPAPTPLTDGRAIPEPMDENPRQFTEEEFYCLKWHMEQRAASEYDKKRVYVTHICRILQPTRWHTEAFRKSPYCKLELATPAQFWKVWHRTHAFYDKDLLKKVLTEKEIQESEDPKKRDEKEEVVKPLAHAAYAAAENAAMRSVSVQMRAEACFQGKQRVQKARAPKSAEAASSSSGGCDSPCKPGANSDSGSDDDSVGSQDGVDGKDLWGDG